MRNHTRSIPSGLRVLVVSLLVAAVQGRADAGTFIGSDSPGFEAAVVHPTGYTGTGGNLNVTVCIDPTSAHAAEMVTPAQNLVGMWNALSPQSPNLFFGANNNVPPTALDWESVALHEVGHCIGLGHPNLATEAGFGFGDPNTNYTKTTKGANVAYDLSDGADNVIGSSDDVRGDDENLHWFRKSNNNPFTIDPTVDFATYSRSLVDLPGGHLFVANADRTVGPLLGFPDSEAVMQQEAFSDEDQRQLGHDDAATLRLGMSGLDETAGTADDYTVTLVYGGVATGCDIDLDFDDTQTTGGVCQASFTQISGNHYRLTSTNVYFNGTLNWFFNPLPTGATTTTTTTTSTTSTTVVAALGHLKCYKTKDARAKAAYALDLIANVPGFPNELGCTASLGAKHVCVEVDKQNVNPSPPGGGPVAPPNAGSTFLSYKLKCPKQTVAPSAFVDQFGTGSFTVGTASELLVPALPGPANDHFKCYKTKDARPKASYTMDLIGGFANELGCVAKLGAKRICVQVAKQNVTPPPPGGGPGPGPGSGQKLLYYKLKCPKGVLSPVGIADQFGVGTFTPGTAKILLVPAS